MKVADLHFARMSGGLPWTWLIVVLGALVCCAPAAAQTVQALPELDTYFKLDSGFRIWLQAKETREGGVPTQAEIGPSLDLYFKSLSALSRIATVDLDESKSRLIVLSLGYRYLPQSNGAPATNRIEPVVTLQVPLKANFEIADRNRGDLDWKTGTFTWRYRNRFLIERPFKAGRVRLTPYGSAEFFYESQYQKWSTTEVDAGVNIPLGSKVEINPYYQHENNTGGSHNQQVNAFGFVLDLYFFLR